MEERARERLPEAVYDYLPAGAGDERDRSPRTRRRGGTSGCGRASSPASRTRTRRSTCSAIAWPSRCCWRRRPRRAAASRRRARGGARRGGRRHALLPVHAGDDRPRRDRGASAGRAGSSSTCTRDRDRVARMLRRAAEHGFDADRHDDRPARPRPARARAAPRADPDAGGRRGGDPSRPLTSRRREARRRRLGRPDVDDVGWVAEAVRAARASSRASSPPRTPSWRSRAGRARSPSPTTAARQRRRLRPDRRRACARWPRRWPAGSRSSSTAASAAGRRRARARATGPTSTLRRRPYLWGARRGGRGAAFADGPRGAALRRRAHARARSARARRARSRRSRPAAPMGLIERSAPSAATARTASVAMCSYAAV